MQLAASPVLPISRREQRPIGTAIASLGLALVVAAVVVVLGAGPARAEHMSQNPSGELSFRGNYWRDRNTRIINPTVDVRQTLPNDINVNAHYLLDAITSASVAAGVSADKPFTELRHEAGFGVEIPVKGKSAIAARYSYSSESDYFSHSAGLRLKLSLFSDNTNLGIGADYTHNTVGKRLGPTGYLTMGELHSARVTLLFSQLLSRRALLTASLESTFQKGYMNNPYRPVFVNGERREFEHLPEFRARNVISVWPAINVPISNSTLVPHLTIKPALRVQLDSWEAHAVSPMLSLAIPVGPTEFRLLFSYYYQRQTFFYSSESGGRMNYFEGTPGYDGMGYALGTKTLANGDTVTNYIYTSDTKLGTYSQWDWELSFSWRLSFFKSLGTSAFAERLSRTILVLTGGMWFANRAVGWQFGIPLRGGDPEAPAGCSQLCGAGIANLGLYIPL